MRQKYDAWLSQQAPEDRQFCLKGILKAEIYVEYEGLAFISATKPTSRGLEDATDHLLRVISKG